MAYRTFQDLKKRRSTALISWQRRESVRRTSALRLLLFGSVALALYFTTHWQQVVTPDEIGLKRQHARFSILVAEEGGDAVTYEVFAEAAKVSAQTRPPPPSWHAVGTVAAAEGVRVEDAVNAQRPLIAWWASRAYPLLDRAAIVSLGVRAAGSDEGVVPVARGSSRDYRPQIDLALVGFDASAPDDDGRRTPWGRRRRRGARRSKRAKHLAGEGRCHFVKATPFVRCWKTS